MAVTLTAANTHDVKAALPTVVAGGGAGTIKGGRHLVYEEGTPLSNLHITLLDKVGVPADKLGDSTGRIAELLG